jgi:hypothetical protein
MAIEVNRRYLAFQIYFWEANAFYEERLWSDL